MDDRSDGVATVKNTCRISLSARTVEPDLPVLVFSEPASWPIALAFNFNAGYPCVPSVSGRLVSEEARV